MLEGPTERNLFQLANGAIVDGRKRSHAIERGTKMRLEPLLSADGRKVLDTLERDVLRIDCHPTQRAIRRRVVRQRLCDWQQLEQTLPGVCEPAVMRSRSPISPIPQLRVDGIEKSGTKFRRGGCSTLTSLKGEWGIETTV